MKPILILTLLLNFAISSSSQGSECDLSHQSLGTLASLKANLDKAWNFFSKNASESLDSQKYEFYFNQLLIEKNSDHTELMKGENLVKSKEQALAYIDFFFKENGNPFGLWESIELASSQKNGIQNLIYKIGINQKLKWLIREFNNNNDFSDVDQKKLFGIFDWILKNGPIFENAKFSDGIWNWLTQFDSLYKNSLHRESVLLSTEKLFQTLVENKEFEKENA